MAPTVWFTIDTGCIKPREFPAISRFKPSQDMPKHVVFDVVGTCVSYDAFYEGIEDHMGPKLRKNGIKPSLFGFAWMESAEREFTYLVSSLPRQ